MKLKCSKHMRRVFVANDGDMIHRTGSGGQCDGWYAQGITVIMPDSNGNRFALNEPFRATYILEDTPGCWHCGADLYSINRNRKGEYCPRRQGNQPHVF